jgi:hypothetical protein
VCRQCARFSLGRGAGELEVVIALDLDLEAGEGKCQPDDQQADGVDVPRLQSDSRWRCRVWSGGFPGVDDGFSCAASSLWRPEG